MYADAALQKVAYDAFFEEIATLLSESRSKVAADALERLYDGILEEYGDEYVKQASDAELEALVKTAFVTQLVKRFPTLGMPAGQGLKQVGSQIAGGVRRGVGAITPTGLAGSGNEFVQRAGQNMSQHMRHSPVISRIGLPGTYTAGLAQSAAQGARSRMVQAGGRLANTAPAGSLRARIGEGMVNAGASSAMGTAVNKAVPFIGHVAGNVTAGTLGLPMLGGLAGKGAVALATKGLSALGLKGAAGLGLKGAAGSALGHGAAQAAGHAAEHGLHGILGHAAEDVIGDKALAHVGGVLRRNTPARGVQVFDRLTGQTNPHAIGAAH